MADEPRNVDLLQLYDEIIADLTAKLLAIQILVNGSQEAIDNMQAGVDRYGRPVSQEVLLDARQDMPNLQRIVWVGGTMMNDIQVQIQETRGLIALEMQRRAGN
ncbi:hypothetical protein V499_01059 [Pseudogymnoascus sp. VKM F-103]|nr:hypothetical protein V499_01059 [Pseudogymnoascus sp. VKM F-103]